MDLRTDDPLAPGHVVPSRRGLRAGAWAAVPVLLAVGPFGFIFGAFATEAGLDPLQTMAMTAIVTAGAAQLAALQLLVDDAPALVAVLTGAVVNLRMAMYSASIAVHWRGVPMLWRVPAAYFLQDQSYTLSLRRYRERPDEPLSDRIGFYFGTGSITVVTWICGSWLGVVAGRMMPPEWGLGFAVPVTFLALVAPLIRGRANIAAAVVAGLAALGLHGLPYGLGLLLAAALGIAAGMAAPRLARRRA
ncbi:MAG TPA: AzlC family ABC transporter permease [Thermohalobaculum sp.]|nr:AzlC family ABC transporter permease [Thermohalobaculum sp.]